MECLRPTPVNRGLSDNHPEGHEIPDLGLMRSLGIVRIVKNLPMKFPSYRVRVTARGVTQGLGFASHEGRGKWWESEDGGLRGFGR